MTTNCEPVAVEYSPWARCVESIQKRAPQDVIAKFAWDAASGESPWQWAERAGIAETLQLEAFAESLGVDFLTDLSPLPSSPTFLAEFPIAYSRRHVMLGLAECETSVKLALGRRASWPQVDVLPVQGINVYDILRHEKLVLTKAAVEALEARFK